ncbi:hypothetical protein [Streptomyces sp. NPDC002133]|uniref:coiled-coil domain-containing protein n=1 Tax=Streptomyces sp. NPDC002133 TaxID=3154409 RepID=UPI0033302E32
MSDSLLRSICTTALAAVTVFAVTATPAAAGPDDPVATAAPGGSEASGVPEATVVPDEEGKPGGRPAPGNPAARTVTGLLGRLRELYWQAEEAGEAYYTTREKLTVQRTETKRLGTALADARNALARSRGEAGRFARQQYQGDSELSVYLHLLFARNPRIALDQGHLMERAARDRAATIARLERGVAYADGLATQARKALDRQQSLAETQREQRATLDTRLKEVAALLASLPSQQLVGPTDPERTSTEEPQQREVPEPGALDSAARTPQADTETEALR